MCARSVHWLMRRDTKGHLTPCAYQDAPSPPMTPQLYESCQRAVHFVLPDGTVLRGGRAFLRVCEELGWRRVARTLGQPPFIWAVELGYTIVARNRPFFAPFVVPGEPKQERWLP